MLTLRSAAIALGLGLAAAAALNHLYITPFPVPAARLVGVALVLLGVYAAAGWALLKLLPRVPAWVRQTGQVVAVAPAAPVAAFGGALLSVGGDVVAFLQTPARIAGFVWVAGAGLVLGLIVAAARGIARRAEVVFVTAYEQYAVQAFEQGALDYLVKPFDEARLADTVQRLQARLAAGAAPPAPARHLQWIKASVGHSVRLIPVDEVAYLRSDEKYTLVAWASGDALIRKANRELAAELDPARFVQVHRSWIVNLHHVAQVVRSPNETVDLHLRGRPEVLPVSRAYLHLFRQM